MTQFVLIDSKLWLDGYAFAGSESASLPPGYVNRIGVTEESGLRDTTRFGDHARRRMGGLPLPRLHMEGFWSADESLTTYEPDKPLYDSVPKAFSDRLVTCAPETGEEGKTAYTFRARTGRYEWGGQVDEVTRFTVDAEGAWGGGGLIRGTVIGNKSVAAGGPTNGTAFQLGALDTEHRMWAALHVLAVTTSVDVLLESDDAQGMGSPTTRITFTQKTDIGSQLLYVDGPITDTWWRIKFTTVGGAPNARFIVTAGIMPSVFI